MPDTAELEMLVRTWSAYIDANPASDDFSRASGYIAGLALCARQLADAITRMQADEAAGSRAIRDQDAAAESGNV